MNSIIIDKIKSDSILSKIIAKFNNEIYLRPIIISIGLFDYMNGPNDNISRYNVENEIKNVYII